MEFDWTKIECCNCGLVAQSKLGIDASSLSDLIYEEKYANIIGYGLWSESVKNLKTCSATGLPLSMIFYPLFRDGWAAKDIERLEYIGAEMSTDDEPLRKDVGEKHLILQGLINWRTEILNTAKEQLSKAGRAIESEEFLLAELQQELVSC